MSASAPVIVDQVQRNDKVAAIVYAPYNGQYGNYALGQLLFGQSTPTAGSRTAGTPA